jgi:hypothetical protein
MLRKTTPTKTKYKDLFPSPVTCFFALQMRLAEIGTHTQVFFFQFSSSSSLSLSRFHLRVVAVCIEDLTAQSGFWRETLWICHYTTSWSSYLYIFSLSSPMCQSICKNWWSGYQLVTVLSVLWQSESLLHLFHTAWPTIHEPLQSCYYCLSVTSWFHLSLDISCIMCCEIWVSSAHCAWTSNVKHNNLQTRSSHLHLGGVHPCGIFYLVYTPPEPGGFHPPAYQHAWWPLDLASSAAATCSVLSGTTSMRDKGAGVSVPRQGSVPGDRWASPLLPGFNLACDAMILVHAGLLDSRIEKVSTQYMLDHHLSLFPPFQHL